MQKSLPLVSDLELGNTELDDLWKSCSFFLTELQLGMTELNLLSQIS